MYHWALIEQEKINKEFFLKDVDGNKVTTYQNLWEAAKSRQKVTFVAI